jgi:hypothetical protein
MGDSRFVCWRALEENPLDILPLRAASAHLPPQPAHDPDAPGPFAFANPDRVRGILERAGFGEIEITARDEQVGSGDVDTMLAVCSRVGALGKILRENPELRAATLPAVRSALAAHDGPDGVRLNAATWVVTARAPAGLERKKSAKAPLRSRPAYRRPPMARPVYRHIFGRAGSEDFRDGFLKYLKSKEKCGAIPP